MLPSKEKDLINNTEFKQLGLSAFATVIKQMLDQLTIPAEGKTVVEYASYADVKLLEFLRGKMRTGSMQNHSKPSELNPIYVTGLLSLFDDEAADDIVYFEPDEQGAVRLDWDGTKPILMSKIIQSGYMYGLAECTAEDFAKTEQDENGNWIEPTV